MNANIIINSILGFSMLSQDLINVVQLIGMGALAIGLIGVIKSLAMDNQNGKKKLIQWIVAVAVFYALIAVV